MLYNAVYVNNNRKLLTLLLNQGTKNVLKKCYSWSCIPCYVGKKFCQKLLLDIGEIPSCAKVLSQVLL